MAFATWDSAKLAAVTLSGGDLTATATASGGVSGQGTNRTGKWYWEITVGSLAAINTNTRLGIGNGAVTGATAQSNVSGTAVLAASGSVTISGIAAAFVSGFAAGNVVCIALDLDLGLLWFRTGSGNWNNSGTASPAAGIGGVSIASLGFGPAFDYYPLAMMGGSGAAYTANFGATAFAQTVPSGFTAGWTTGTQVDNIVTTRAGREVWITEPGTLRTSRVGREVWFQLNPFAVVTRTGRELWIDHSAGYVTPPTTGRPKRRVVVISGE